MAGKGEGEIGSALASAYGSGGQGYGAGRFLGGQGVGPNLLGGSPTPTFASAPTPLVKAPGSTTLASQPFTTPSLSYGPIYWQQMAQAQADAKKQAAADAAVANIPGSYQPGGYDYGLG